MDLLWIILLMLFLNLYAVTDGFAIGVGMLLHRMGRTSEQRRTLLTVIGPFFLGNEVWLVVAGGVLAGAFPLAEARLSEGLYLMVVAGLLIWASRDASIWFRSRLASVRWRVAWDRVLNVASVAFAAFWGAAVGAALHGTGPFTLVWATVAVVLLAAHGAVFAALRSPAELAVDAQALASRLLGPAAVLLALAPLTGFLIGGLPGESLPLAVPVAVPVAVGGAGAAALWTARTAVRAESYGRAVALTSTAITSVTVLVGVRLGPELAQAAAGAESLRVLGGFALILLPLLAGAQVWMWRTFRQRVDARTVLFF
ncbi:cytochrome bd-I ubiquinol oxidase subunit 2 apoprotein [Nonomuraea fuscirosea]|uniref:Cytochrome bd-I ubiquinol oxidase subunit 2 apoprotein n=1 Tax=Nonomuraea fuscirosea TaxID=1291556 RepID=A0A2T0MXE5_9ACTN|nr:cytochrome d ubiquinol oxidase subunit II [Nonomuraea fuscirosea]PRX63750.1 cytochrome bd-I ubiquinol oxidase subunit 2 apoprotein [Nonomuraea fuscirosea]